MEKFLSLTTALKPTSTSATMNDSRTPNSLATTTGPLAAFMSRSSPRSGAAITWEKLSRRSEEHTSELQSRLHLVCRLLLEKKKKYIHTHNPISITFGTSSRSQLFKVVAHKFSINLQLVLMHVIIISVDRVWTTGAINITQM